MFDIDFELIKIDILNFLFIYIWSSTVLAESSFIL